LSERQRKTIVLDRDGVINADSAEYIKSVEEWQPLPGSLEAIAALTRAGYDVFVVSNQSGLYRGLFDRDALAAIHRRMRDAVAAAGGRIAGIYFCPHGPDEGCNCRKPAPGMLLQLAAEHDVALPGVPFIGDKWSDVLAARAVGARPILVRTGHGDVTAAAHADEIVDLHSDLAAAVRALLEEAEA
jgi:D-glycero-D-manno-heptose 1,7-bisphosphate phosphatase